MKKGLSEKAYWEDIYYKDHKKRIWAKYLPDPLKYRGHYELDNIFKTLLKYDNSKKLLELGAGDSIWLPYFGKQFGFEVYGIDYSERGCKKAERNLNLARVEGNILCTNFFEIQSQWKDFFDIIISFGVVEHFDNPVEIIKVINSFLKKGGLVITVTPNTAGLIFHLQKIVDKDVYNTHKIFAIDNLAGYHSMVGMEVLAKRYIQFMDLSIIYSKKNYHKYLSRAITLLNLPILYLQRMFNYFPENKKWCSSMVVVAKK